MEWISVKDRLPTEEGDYLIRYKDKDDEGVERIVVYVDRFKRYWREENISDTERRSFLSEKPCFDPFWEVTHWMPLPPPPERK